MVKLIFAIMSLSGAVSLGMYYAYMTEYGETGRITPKHRKVGALVPYVFGVFISMILMCWC